MGRVNTTETAPDSRFESFLNRYWVDGHTKGYADGVEASGTNHAPARVASRARTVNAGAAVKRGYQVLPVNQ